VDRGHGQARGMGRETGKIRRTDGCSPARAEG
jgi:hypothetical protein